MPNTYFKFKQFTVHQENAALKVSTDSCLFGAWISELIRSKSYEVRNIFDVGAGSGLLMLMLAQKCNAMIVGIEIDEPSYLQANENIELSLWKERLHLLHGDVKEFVFNKKYDLIISNPPFYEGNLKSDRNNRNIAMHNDGLKLDALLEVVDHNLTDEGLFAVLLPFHRSAEAIAKALTKNLYLQVQVNVKQTVSHGFFRTMFLFGRKNELVAVKELSVKNAAHEYTDEFIDLLKDYYLYL